MLKCNTVSQAQKRWWFFSELSRSSSLYNAYESCPVALAALHVLAKCSLPSSRPESFGWQDIWAAFPWAGMGRDGVLATTPEVLSRCNVQEVLDLSSCLIVQFTYDQQISLASVVAFILKKYLRGISLSIHTWTCVFFFYYLCCLANNIRTTVTSILLYVSLYILL